MSLSADGSFTYTPDAGFSGTDTVTMTVTPPPPSGDTRPTQVWVGDLWVTEGNAGTTAASFTVTRSGIISGSSTVKYKTSGGTAAAGVDYAAVALGTLSFAPGETTKAVSVDIAGDLADEANETLMLALSAPSAGTVVSDASGTATIVDDD